MCDLSPNDEAEWLDLAYITKILNHHTQNELSDIKSFTKVPATTKGENFASAMHLVTVDYITKSEPQTVKIVSLIVKSRLDNELMSKIEEEFNVFHREAQMYTVIMDEAIKVMRSLGDPTLFGPRAIYVDERVIVQENLKLKGYSIMDIKKGLDLPQCRLIVEKLAKFHAVGMILYRKSPDAFRHHLPGNVSENPSPLHDLYANAIQTTIKYCTTNTKLEQYVPKLEAFGDKIIPKMINVFSRNQVDRFHVLNHGDLWVNNLMFHKDETSGQFDDVLFVDYQEGFYGSPGIDWNYFIFSSWQKEVFENDFDSLVELYHGTLAKILNELNFEQRIPTLKDVHREIINKGYHGLSTATCLLPILINEHEELTDPMYFLLDTDEAKKNRSIIFNNPKFGEKLELFLPFFVKNGIL